MIVTTTTNQRSQPDRTTEHTQALACFLAVVPLRLSAIASALDITEKNAQEVLEVLGAVEAGGKYCLPAGEILDLRTWSKVKRLEGIRRCLAGFPLGLAAIAGEIQVSRGVALDLLDEMGAVEADGKYSLPAPPEPWTPENNLPMGPAERQNLRDQLTDLQRHLDETPADIAEFYNRKLRLSSGELPEV